MARILFSPHSEVRSPARLIGDCHSSMAGTSTSLSSEHQHLAGSALFGLTDYFPVPFKATKCGAPSEPIICKFPIRGPEIAGLKETCTLHWAPGASVCPQSFFWEKSIPEVRI